MLKVIEAIDGAIDDAEKLTDADDPQLRKTAFDLCRKLFNVNRALLARMLPDFDSVKATRKEGRPIATF